MLSKEQRAILRHLVALVAVLALGVLPGATALHAQDRDRLVQELEATQSMLERARAAVDELGHPRAATELRFAYRLQEEAWNLARTGTTLLEFRRAYELTQRARFLAQRAVNIASQQAHLEQRAQRMLEQFERDLDSARERARANPSPGSRRVLELAERRLEQAREAFHEHRYQEVIQMTEETERLLATLGEPPPERRLDEMLENTRRLLERAEGESPDADSAALLLRARELLQQAEALAPARPDAAEAQLRQARELILRALQRSETPLDPGGVDQALAETTTFIDGVAERVRDSGNPEAAEALENSRRHLQRAHELRSAGRLRVALEEARVARNLARRAAQAAGIPQP